MANAVKKDRELLYIAIYFVIVALFFFVIPPIEPITKPGMRVLGLFFAAIFGWTASSEVWPSIFTTVLFMFTGLMDITSMLAATWGGDIFLFMVFMFMVVAYLQYSGASKFASAWLLTRKFLIGHPWRIIGMLMVIAWLLSIFAGILAGLLITWGFIYQICGLMGYKPFSKEASAMIFGVGLVGALSLSTVPFLHNALVILAAFTSSTGIEINLLHYLAYTVPTDLLCIAAYLLMCKFIFRIDVSKMKEMTVDFIPAEDLVCTKEVAYALIFLVVLVAALLLPNVLPATVPLKSVIKSIGNSGICFIVFGIWSLIKVNDKKIFDIGQLAAKGINWNMLLMTFGIFGFISLLANPATGISAFLGAHLAPIFMGKPIVLFVAIAMLITIILTNFMINMVIAVLMMAATFPVATQLGIDVTQLGYLYTVCATIAFCLPAASPAGMLLFANKEWLNAKEIYKFAIPTALVMAVVALLWNLILFKF